MVFAQLLILAIILSIAIIILNVIIPYMFPKYKYWWMFRKNKIIDATREYEMTKEEIEAHCIKMDVSDLLELLNKTQIELLNKTQKLGDKDVQQRVETNQEKSSE